MQLFSDWQLFFPKPLIVDDSDCVAGAKTLFECPGLVSVQFISWLVVWHICDFSILGISSSTHIFQRGRSTTNQFHVFSLEDLEARAAGAPSLQVVLGSWTIALADAHWRTLQEETPVPWCFWVISCNLYFISILCYTHMLHVWQTYMYYHILTYITGPCLW
jgi:hypothetical protein